MPPGLSTPPRGRQGAQPPFAPGDDATVARAEPQRSYAGPVVVVDVLSIGAMLGAFPGRAAASLAIRAAALGLATGAIIEDVLVHHCDGDVSPCGAPVGGIALGALVAIGAAALDDALLAREPERPAAGPTSAQLTPGLAVGPRTALLSLGGRF